MGQTQTAVYSRGSVMDSIRRNITDCNCTLMQVQHVTYRPYWATSSDFQLRPRRVGNHSYGAACSAAAVSALLDVQTCLVVSEAPSHQLSVVY